MKLALALTAVSLAACGDDPDVRPIDAVVFGETTIIAIANPLINDDNQAAIATPGGPHADLTVSDDTGLVTVTDGEGIGVLSPVVPGQRIVSFRDGVDGDVEVPVGEGELVEVAVAVDNGAEIMTLVDYDLDATIVELTPDMTPEEIEGALAMSDTLILLRVGTYVVGDIEMAGSRLTVFAEGILDRTVVIEGNVLVKGSENRLRGLAIDGNLRIEGSSSAVAFTSVFGATTVPASAPTLFYNDFCGAVDVTGSNVTAVGNAGMSPIAPICP